jgi:hemin uptake protein HemP
LQMQMYMGELRLQIRMIRNTIVAQVLAERKPMPQNPPEPPGPGEPALSGEPRPSIDSASILRGRSEVVIRHGGREYRLRRTRLDKLILTA